MTGLEPLAVGAVLWGANNILPNILASRMDKHVLDSILDRCINHDIQKAIRAAWIESVAFLFAEYRKWNEYKQLPTDHRKRIDELEEVWVWQETVEKLFPTDDDETVLLAANDIAQLFIGKSEEINSQLIAEIETEYWWLELPDGLKQVLRQRLLLEITCRFINIAITRAPKARDTLFFQQFIALRQTAVRTDAAMAGFQADVRSRLEEFEDFQRWLRDELPRLIADIQEMKADVKDIAYKVTQQGGDLQTAIGLLKEIADQVRGVGVPELRAQDDYLVAEHRPPTVKLHARQTHYLERHGLFAGRKAQLDSIASFLQTRRQGYIFVTGPSGYGKSALLANLVAPQREQWAWYFLNGLDNTHHKLDFLRQVYEQLMAYYQMPIRSESDLPDRSDRLEALYAELLRMPLVQTGRPLVLVIDGVDEAEDNFINDLYIPRDLPDGKFVIFSARQTGRDYLTELGLPRDDVLTIELGILNRNGIRALLEAKGGVAKRWADNPELVSQVERVSEGDPFYLHHLVEDIATGRITPEQINSQPSGLEAYLDGWWRQVAGYVRDDRELRDLFGTLMVALGPFPHGDLVSLYPEMEWSLGDILRPDRPVGRFVVSEQDGGQTAYVLCHTRFRDYLRYHKLPNQAAMYQQKLLDYCARWPETHSSYALQYLSAHLLEARRYDDLLALVDKPFLSAKVRKLRSFTGALADLRNAVQAAAAVHDPVKMLGLALAHSGLQTRVAQLATDEVIPLYARFGQLDRALDYTHTIRDETERAKTLVAVAREVASSDTDMARQIVRQVLSNWQLYDEFSLGEILLPVLTFLPDELLTFLEGLDDTSLIVSAGIEGIDLYALIIGQFWHFREIARSAWTLPPKLQERLRAVLARALGAAPNEKWKRRLCLLLVQLEPDPGKSDDYAESEVERIIVQAKRDRTERPDGTLSEHIVEQTIQMLARGANTGEREALLDSVVAAHAHQFVSTIARLSRQLEQAEIEELGFDPRPVWKVHRLLEIGLAVLEMNRDVNEAKTLLLEALRIDSQSSQMYYAFSFLLEAVTEGIASKSFQAAFDFLETPEVASVLSQTELDRFIASAVAAAAKTDTEQALSIWRKCNPDWQDKPKLLLRILHNAPPSASAGYIEVLETEFKPVLRYQLYKVPTLLEIAVRLKLEQPERAKAIAETALQDLAGNFERARWTKARKNFFLARIVPTVAACGLVEKAEALVDLDMRDDFGLRFVAQADLVRIQAENPTADGRAAKNVRELEGWITNYGGYGHRYGLDESHRWGLQIQRAGGLTYEIMDLAESPNTMGSARLIGLYLLNKARDQVWKSDFVRALVATKVLPLSRKLALHCVSGIEDEEIRQLTMTELSVSAKHMSELEHISREELRALALVRIAGNERDAARREDLLQDAFAQAEASAKSISDGFTLKLLIEFVREACQLDTNRSRQFSSALIDSVLSSASVPLWNSADGWVHQLFELAACGYAFPVDKSKAIQSLCDRWVEEQEYLSESGSISKENEVNTHVLAVEQLTLMTSSTLLANKEYGLMLIENAERHTAAIPAEGRPQRMYSQRSILRSLLSSCDVQLWEEAVRRSLEFDDAIFKEFDKFGSTLLESYPEDTSLPLRLLEVIEWAEQLMMV